jgi:integrase
MTKRGQTQKRNTIPGVYPYRTRTGLKRWAAVVDDGTPTRRHQKRRRGFPTQAKAAAWRADYQARLRRGEIGEPSTMLLAEYVTAWLEVRSASIRPSTVRHYRKCFALLSDDLGAIPLARLTPSVIERAYITLLARVKPATARMCHRMLRAVLRTAVRDGLLTRDPGLHVAAPGTVTNDRTAWSIETTRAFLAGAADDPYADAWYVLLECWLRSGELRALAWSHFDANRSVLLIRRTVTTDEHGAMIFGPPKTASSVRDILLSPGLCARLKARRKEQQIDAMQSGEGWSDDRLIFPNTRGGVMHASLLSWALRRACARTGVPYLGVHGLRHTGGSIVYATKSMPTKLITERMGHSRVAITEEIYLHSDEVQHQKLADAIGNMLSM